MVRMCVHCQFVQKTYKLMPVCLENRGLIHKLVMNVEV